MEMELEDLLALIDKESEKKEFLRLGQDYHQARQQPGANRSNSAPNPPPEEILDQIMKQIQWHFRAIRHPMPTRQQVEEMIMEHFK